MINDNNIDDEIAKFENGVRYNLGWGSLNPEVISEQSIDLKSEELSYYGSALGEPELVNEVASFLSRKTRCSIEKERILITAGATNGIFLLAYYFKNYTNHGTITVQNPTFDTALRIFEMTGLKVKPIAPELGIEPPKGLTYVSFKYHNPTGYSVPYPGEIAFKKENTKNNDFIIEDDCYSFLGTNFKYSFPKNNYIYLSSFSKYLFPGLRIGVIYAPEEIIHDLAIIQKYFNSSPSLISQRYVLKKLKDKSVDEEINKKREYFLEKRRMFEDSISPLVKSLIYTNQGLFYYWLTLPTDLSEKEVFKELLKAGFITVPGDIYRVKENGEQNLRISISKIAKADIRTAAKGLSAALARIAEASKQ